MVALTACASEPDADSDTERVADVSATSADVAAPDAVTPDPIEAPTEADEVRGQRVVLTRFYGTADPVAGTMTITRVEDTAVGSTLRTVGQASWCPARVVQDGVSGSSPPDSLELESDDATVAASRPGEPTAPECVNADLAGSRPQYDDLYPVKGVFCGDVAVRNFYGVALDNVHIEIRYSGDPAHQPYQYPYGNAADPGAVDGPFAPSAADGGLFRVGDLAPAEVFGDSAVVQLTFENGTDAPFEFEGEVSFEAIEDCDNEIDDDCDGVVNNTCGEFEEGDSCFEDSDCFSGRCIDGVCDGGCPPGRYGADCDPCPGGAATPCNDNGTCDDGEDGTGLCSCDAGFTGAACDACEPGRFGALCVPCPGGAADPCGGNGTCDDGIDGTGACACADGYAGGSCNACASGYYGPDCDACPDCGVNGTCAEGIGGDGTCVCAPGFTGAACDACTVDRAGPDCDPCPGGVGNACNSNGTCDDGIGGTGACACDAAWAGADCSDCASGYYGPSCTPCPGGAADPCGGFGTCNDGRAGDGTCACDPGRAGLACADCASGYYGPSCNPCPPCGPNGTCDDGIAGGGVCACDVGWAGAACDSCAPGFFGPDCLPCRDCGATGTCRDGLGGDGSCACDPGFTGVDCDTCLPNYYGASCTACPNCGANGTCDDGIGGGGTCSCDAGWTGALCNTCQPGFYGPSCSACPACGANGTCRDGLGGNGTCACDVGWAGALCNTCAPGYYGPSCTACPSCGANGACNDGLGGNGACVCDPGFHGAACQFSCSDGAQNGDETGVDCGGSECSPCTPLGTSCNEILADNPGATSGVYRINPGGTTVEVYCDMTTDGGGWTLVANTRGTTLDDRGGAYYADLAVERPVSPHTHIWDGLRPVVGGNSDVRFSCRTTDRGGSYNVDLSFYDVGWYRELTASTSDASVCFEESNGAGDTQPTPRRRNNLNGQVRTSGDQWNWGGYLEGEDSCGDTGDFTVDFDDRGMDSNQLDGTDWGEDDGSRKCGSVYTTSGNWQIWVREPNASANQGRSCQDILARNPGSTNGVYQVDPEGDGSYVDAYCDMTTDGGGWTLVANTRNSTLNDRAGGYYADLARSRPLSAQDYVWNGMRARITNDSDIRFTCRNSDRDGAFTVDLSFYDINWYMEITASGSDAGVCFEQQNGAGDTQPEPARRNNINGQFRGLNDSWNWGYLEGEDSCGDTGDFTVDFDDRGMDSNQSDGTDWGEDDGSRKCGTSGLGSGNWQIWTREIGGDATPPSAVETCDTYTAAATTYRWLTPSSWTNDATSGYDDGVGPAINLPFTFSFFDTDYTQVRISSNGFVYLGNAGGTSGCCNGGTIPSATDPDGMIAAYWTDLNPSAGGTIRYGTYGTAPNRIFVIEYNGVYEYGRSNRSTFQVHIEETTQQVAVMCASCSVSGHTVTQGIEGAGGSAGIARAGRMTTAWSASGDGTRFTPSCGGGGGGVDPGAAAVCSGAYRNLTRADRNRSFNDGNGNVEFCERNRNDGEYTGPGWYRFSGAAGTRIPTTRPNYYDCGTDAPGYINGSNPAVGDGIVTRQVCYYWSGSSCRWSNNIRMANCGGFYLYELQDTPVCALRYCGE